jgi:hypothetical protein
MLALVKLVYRGADLWGALGFFMTDFGRVRRRRRREGPEARPLRATLFTFDTLRDRAGRPSEPPDLAMVRRAFADHAVLTVVSVADKSDDEIRRLADGLNLRAEDLLITDMPKAARALSVLRAARPHLQIVLWMRNPKPVNYLKGVRRFWERRKGVLVRLMRDRALFAAADQVVVAAAWLDRPLARTLLPMRRRTVIPPAPEKAAVQAWRAVLEDARIWAPRRLRP